MRERDELDPRFVEQLWARLELEAFGPQRVYAPRAVNRRPQVLMAAAAAVTALAMVAVSSLQTPQAMDRLDLDRAVPVPSAVPAQDPEAVPDPDAERVGPAPLVAPLAGPRPALPELRREDDPVARPPAAAPVPGLGAVAPAARPPAPAARREQRIVFASRRSGNGEVYTMALDGSDVQQVSLTPAGGAYNRAGEWSPDGKWIAYGGVNGLVVVRPDGEDARVVAKNTCLTPEDPSLCPGDVNPSWSPDGRWLVFNRGYEESPDCGPQQRCASLWVVRRDGSGLRQLSGTGREPHWSPDGQRIVFVDGSGSSSGACGSLEGSRGHCPAPVFTIRPDGSDRRPLGLVGDYPRWSPDGRFIAYGSQSPGLPHDVYVAAADGSQVRRVTEGPGTSGGASWSSDGTTLAYHYLAEGDPDTNGDAYEIYVRRLDGTGGARRITTSPTYDIFPRFSPG